MLASDLRLTQSEREVPSSRQCSPLSPLQRLVKDARRIILDPVLDPLDFSSDSADEEDELTPHERRKERERAKIRELRMRRIGEGGLTLPINGGQEDGVFIRRDLDDESGEVDISLQDIMESRTVAIRAMQDTSTEDAKQTNHPPLPTTSSTLHSAPPKPPRPRRSVTKAQPTTPLTVKINLQKKKRPPEPEPEQALEEDVESRTTKRSRGSGKPKPETFNQAWSVSEQHLLERLLEEIPDGEKNRYMTRYLLL